MEPERAKQRARGSQSEPEGARVSQRELEWARESRTASQREPERAGQRARESQSEPEGARLDWSVSQREPEWARGSQIRLECEPERARKRQSELERLWADVAFYCTLGSLFGRQITKERLDTHLACLNIVLLQNSFKYDSVLSRNVKIRYFLSRNVKIRAMSRKNGINYATSWLRILFYSE